MKLFQNLKKKRMNNKGQLIVLNMMIAMTVIITAIIFIDPLKEVIGIGQTELDCSNYAGLSTGNRMTCIWLDYLLPGFILACLGVGIAYLGARTIPGGQ
ncbi:MAG TPA: hypothetical protein PLT65_04360 [Bacilli bacterium]|nr:hypothetical protein [Bacilli bacterium]